MSTELKKNDQVITSKGSSIVTQINDKSIWLDGKRYGLQAVLKDLKSVLYATNPDKKIDWTNLKEVKDFYFSFNRWSFYISGGCKYTTELCEIKKWNVMS